MRRAAAAVVLLAWAGPLRAQCPDGAPPPCRTRPLDERAWLVLPFNNVSGAADAAWLQRTSVNLLYLSLSKWSDLRVIDDEHVSDMLRGRPADAPVGLRDALALGRRAGVGTIVLGDLISSGTSITVLAKVYRVQTGVRLREASVQLPAPDSLFVAYGQLARDLLRLPRGTPAADAVGTTSLVAYREYGAALASQRSWELDSAAAGFRRALLADTGFALAHLELARTLAYRLDTTGSLGHAVAAARRGGGLPARERTRIAGYVDFLSGRHGPARAAQHELIARDSADADAWFQLGESDFHDNQVVLLDGRAAFSGSWNSARAAFLRALALDPSYHLAYAHLVDINRADSRVGCEPQGGAVTACLPSTHRAFIWLDGDTLVTLPRPWEAFDSLTVDQERATRSGLWTRGRERARDDAARWVRNGPTETDAHVEYGETLLRLGDASGAARELAVAGDNPTRLRSARAIARLRFEAAVKRDSFRLASAIADSLNAQAAPRSGDPSNAANALLGRFRTWEQRLPPRLAPATRAYMSATVRVMAGIVPPNLDAVERALIEAHDPNAGVRRRAAMLFPTITWGLRFRGPAGLPVDTSENVSALAMIPRTLIVGDTAKARRLVLQLEARLADMDPEELSVTLQQLAETRLLLGDSARALELLGQLAAQVFPRYDITEGPDGWWRQEPARWGRAFLLQGDLAAAAGSREVMIRAYRRVVGIWASGDAELQPLVARAAAALSAAGVTP